MILNGLHHARGVGTRACRVETPLDALLPFHGARLRAQRVAPS